MKFNAKKRRAFTAFAFSAVFLIGAYFLQVYILNAETVVEIEGPSDTTETIQMACSYIDITDDYNRNKNVTFYFNDNRQLLNYNIIDDITYITSEGELTFEQYKLEYQIAKDLEGYDAVLIDDENGLNADIKVDYTIPSVKEPTIFFEEFGYLFPSDNFYDIEQYLKVEKDMVCSGNKATTNDYLDYFNFTNEIETIVVQEFQANDNTLEYNDFTISNISFTINEEGENYFEYSEIAKDNYNLEVRSGNYYIILYDSAENILEIIDVGETSNEIGVSYNSARLIENEANLVYYIALYDRVGISE